MSRLRSLLLTLAAAVSAVLGAWGVTTSGGTLTVMGATQCLPGIGTLVWVRPGMAPDLEAGVLVHEARHVAQARELGCLGLMRAGASVQGIATLEAQALCAEEVWNDRHRPYGEDPTAAATRNLWDGYPRVRPLGFPRIARIVTVACAEEEKR
jgi:hypothetical protein